MLTAQGLLDTSGTSLLQIDWKILSACNYRCTYCFDQHKPVHESMCLENIFKTAQKILDMKRPRYHFRFVGGEPSLYPHLHPLMEYIQDKNANVFFEIISNGSQSTSYFKSLFANFPEYICRVHISVHVEYAEKDHIARIMETIVSLHQYALARVMFHPVLKAKSIDFANFLLRLAEQVPFEICINALRQPPNFINFDSRYIKSDFATMNGLDGDTRASYQPCHNLPLFYDDHTGPYYLPHSRAYRNGLCAFENFTCLAGLNTLYIEPDLFWRPATCYLFAKSTLPFYADSTNLHLTEKKCTYAQCGCDANYIIPKFYDPLASRVYQSKFEVVAI